MQFKFPVDLEEIQSLKNLIQAQQRQQKLTGIRLKYLKRKHYLYVNCLDCKSSLRYTYEQQTEQFKLRSVNAHHNHPNFKHVRTNQVLKYIQSLPLQIQQKTAKKLVKKQFNVSNSTFYYYYAKAREPRQTLDQILRNMDQEGSFIHIDPYDQQRYPDYPQMLIIVLPEMKKLFQKYYQYISLDFTFNLVSENHPNGKSYKAGYILGSSLSLRIIPFAIVLVLQETKQVYYRVLKSFGEIMSKMPNAIFTDDTLGARYGIKDLIQQRQFEGFHGLDLFHVLKNTKKRLNNKENIYRFSELAAITTKAQFQLKVEQFYGNIEEDDAQKLTQFIKNSNQYCFSQLPAIGLIGFTATTGSNEKSHDLLKQIIPMSKPLPVVIRKMIQHCRQMINKCEQFKIQRTTVEKFYLNNHIRQVRLQLDWKIFKHFCNQLSRVISTQVESIQQEVIIVRDLTNDLRFRLESSIIEEKTMYICECRYFEKTGLPCLHQLRLLILKRYSLIGYIDKRWRISSCLEESCKKRIPSKKTRRRIN